ncbi:lipoprotein-34 precursor (NlpB) [Acinetobacter calcoaceticus]|uniref:lipoprotein-34 precursor (NlpB) n=1 Tax=Acinetobacter TaxID=469 RepID=UPI0009ADFDBA|nr:MULTISPECIES: lipoprotein-34 precursor (NlpB) [Acinetobacter]AQZ83926.1 lipoprotein-34 precursor (NlpB) [Acinetobacter calcoaceticus]MDS7928563.1 lipoprotein-34 precursor (NlpB) [Acinetobacter sp. V102_4]UGQ28056.1 lipoprotein-34 precursor (NlpB) [Acinetobacter calcoaceticus]UGQ31614.1 lipoprotein-34 precursor (NlpB) [Acinetobacter calcoaceticus]
MQLRLGLVLAVSALSLAGCGRFAINNHSLDYKNAKQLAPLEYPADATVRPATPLYPAPTVDQLAIEHAPKFENKRGNRFALPRPEETQGGNATADASAQTGSALGRPQLVTDGNKNPLLKIDGNTTEIWQYAKATLSTLNYNIIAQGSNQATIKVNDNTYVLKLTGVGSSHTLALFNVDNTFASPDVAAEVLNQIYQNWPA